MIRFVVFQVNLWDQWMLHSLFDWRKKQLFDRLFFNISRSADGPFYAIVAILLLLMQGEKDVHLFLAMLFAFALELSLYKILKNGIKRPRPFDELDRVQFVVAPPDRFSFPSGHTAAAFVMAIILTTGFPVLQPLLLTWATMVGASRIYLGVHYPTDVLMGAVLGSGSAIAGLFMAGVILSS